MSLIAALRRLLGGPPQTPSVAPAAAGPRAHSVQCCGPHGLHRMHYLEWGDPANPRVLVCVHGLTRNARDFDDLARALAGHYRVICPDVAGRGKSDWLAVKADYQFPTYVADMFTLLARLDVETVDWVGTSMGGLIGMLIASLPGNPIRKLVLNDVGPLITAQSLRRIGEYVGKAPVFPDRAAAEAYIRAVSAPFGQLTDAQWAQLTDSSIRQTDAGWAMAYDPGIGDAFRQAPVVLDVDLWPVYDSIRCPVLLVRGAESDLLLDETARRMTERGPQARRVDIPGVGHAPTLMDEAQIAPVRSFLLEGVQ